MAERVPLILGSVFIALLAYKFFRPKKAFGDVPGPVPRSWLFGNMLELQLYSPYGKHEFEWQKQYGPIYSIKGCIGEDRLMVSDTTALRAILADTGDFRKSPQHQLVNKEVFGDGSVLYVHGEQHRRIRAVMNPAFSTAAIRARVHSLQACAQHLSEKWEARLEFQSTAGIFDIFQDIHETTLSGVTDAVMGYDVTNDKEFTKAYKNLVITGAKRSKIAIVAHAVLLALPPWAIDVLKLFPPRDFKTLLKHCNASQRRADIFLKSQIEARKLGIEPENDLFNVMRKMMSRILILEPHLRHRQVDSHKASAEVSLQEIKDQFGTITVAGEDTTANSIVWALYQLAKNLDYQKKIREEFVEAQENKRKEGLEFYESLPFLNALETLRFYSMVPYSERIAIKDTVIPVSQPITTRSGQQITQIPVKKGQYVQIAISSYHRLSSLWGPDAEEFNPMRWLDGRTKLGDKALGPYANLLTFLGGPRTCLGWRFAVLEMQIVLCELVRKFNLALPENSTIETAHAISLVPIHNRGDVELLLCISCA
ncbi:unnamed protein product [Cyclocybe aegerita]|uniref:Cytochrome P450 n=1 Tax=Cyclocybe aegerita TaxID=1973307 RepID=A0A8S0X6M1_CYCAE|nr:unnamed protein product [Cyclocybe aegerita]